MNWLRVREIPFSCYFSHARTDHFSKTLNAQTDLAFMPCTNTIILRRQFSIVFGQVVHQPNDELTEAVRLWTKPKPIKRKQTPKQQRENSHDMTWPRDNKWRNQMFGALPQQSPRLVMTTVVTKVRSPSSTAHHGYISHAVWEQDICFMLRSVLPSTARAAACLKYRNSELCTVVRPLAKLTNSWADSRWPRKKKKN